MAELGAGGNAPATIITTRCTPYTEREKVRERRVCVCVCVTGLLVTSVITHAIQPAHAGVDNYEPHIKPHGGFSTMDRSYHTSDS